MKNVNLKYFNPYKIWWYQKKMHYIHKEKWLLNFPESRKGDCATTFSFWGHYSREAHIVRVGKKVL